MENPNEQPSNSLADGRSHAVQYPIAVLVLLSLVFGALGGSLSTYYLLRSPQSGMSAAGQRLTVTEDSAIIDVVKKASPAVVSIIISQDFNKVPGYGADPNQPDPFYFFF